MRRRWHDAVRTDNLDCSLAVGVTKISSTPGRHSMAGRRTKRVASTVAGGGPRPGREKMAGVGGTLSRPQPTHRRCCWPCTGHDSEPRPAAAVVALRPSSPNTPPPQPSLQRHARTNDPTCGPHGDFGATRVCLPSAHPTQPNQLGRSGACVQPTYLSSDHDATTPGPSLHISLSGRRAPFAAHNRATAQS